MSRPTIIGLALAVAFGLPLLLLGRPYGLPTGLFLMGLVALTRSLLDRDQLSQGGAAFVFCAGLALVNLGGHGPVPAPLGWLVLAAGAVWLGAAVWLRRGAAGS